MRRSCLAWRLRAAFTSAHTVAASTQQGMASHAAAVAAVAGALPALQQRARASSSTLCSPAASSLLHREQLNAAAVATARRTARRVMQASAAAGDAGAGAGNGGTSAGRRTQSSELRRLRGVGPANEELLRQQQILRLADLQQLYSGTCNNDAGALAQYLLSKVGIRRQHSDMIAVAMQRWVEEQRGGQASGEDGSQMVTLAVEGNISAGKSTFLDVLSHKHTELQDMLTVVQEPVSQWQAVECKDRNGRSRVQNVLAKFYENPDRYAYSFQHYVLISRMEQDRRTRKSSAALRVLERSIFSDRQVFVRAMHSAGTMEDFEVSVYNQIFDDHVSSDLGLVPDGFVYLRASPDTCMQRLKKRSRAEEVGIDHAYLEMLHANHEDWLLQGQRLSSYGLDQQMSVLSPVPESAAARFAAGMAPGQSTDWTVELIRGAPAAIKDQVVLLKGHDGLPQLRNRLALVMDHDRDVDVQNDESARQEYAKKILAFYEFVRKWKKHQLAAAETKLEELHHLPTTKQLLRQEVEKTLKDAILQEMITGGGGSRLAMGGSSVRLRS